MEPCINLNTKCSIILNAPIYDEKCKYFNTNDGCYFGENCNFKHVINYQPQSMYKELMQNQIMMNEILKNVLSILTNIIGPNSKSTSSLEPEQTIESLQDHGGFDLLSPELESEPTTTPKLKPKSKKDKKKKKKRRKQVNPLLAFRRSPTPPATPTMPKVQTKPDETPTATYFTSTQQTSHVITDTKEKALFIEWIVKSISNENLDDETLDDLVTHILNQGPISSDIVTGNKCVALAEMILKEWNIKDRKLLNKNNENDE